MKNRVREILIALAVAAVFVPTTVALGQSGATTQASPSLDGSLAGLERELTRISAVAGGTTGVTAIHVETGRRVSVNGATRFPMASTYKVPIAVQLLARVDRGEIHLDDMVTLKPTDYHPGSGTLTDLFSHGGTALSVRNLMELMLLISDNSATDLALGLAGGPQAVTTRMKELGIDGIDVSRPTLNLITDWAGVPLPASGLVTPDAFGPLVKAVTPEESKRAAERFLNDPRDTASPDAMATLLTRIHTKDVLSAASADLLLDIMRRCQTGPQRLKGMLPKDTVIAHKTGTIGGTTNDVGIITLPDGAGHVVVAAFVKGSDKDVPERERGIAEIGRAVYDYFLFTRHPGL